MFFIVRNQIFTLYGHAILRNSVCSVSSKFAVAQHVHGTRRKDITLRNIGNVGVTSRLSHTAAYDTWLSTKDESRELMALWPDIVRNLANVEKSDIPDVTKWVVKVLQYNVPSGKKYRSLSLVYAYRLLVSPEQLTEDNLRLARILGWSLELFQAFLLLIDDIQDQSKTRRNQPCWYLHNDINLAAINDGIFLDCCTFQLIQIYFKDKDCYTQLTELMLKCKMHTIMGQCMDLLSTNFGKKPNLDLFTMDRYNSIVKYKTAYYSFVEPITCAMIFAGIKDPEMYRQAKTILLEMGHFFQVQDDFLDCYGDPQVTGKFGTDIQEGKCTWLVVVALQRATQEQRKILEECYGCKDSEKIKCVKQLYNDLGLPNTYSTYEEETYNLLNTHIQQISRGLPHNLFLNLLKKIYRRED